jgi:cellulose synthase/poly-beta-1,6-N-acetylglucosamine synthase-like glycosyltransferase
VIRENLADVILIFDADYLPGRKLLKELVVPFLDPEIGAVMAVSCPRTPASTC